MIKLRNTAILLILSLFIACGSNVQHRKNELFQKSIDIIRISNALPALTVGVFSGDSIYNISCSGMKIKGSNRAVDTSSIFHLGSNTKAFIGFAAASMVEEGIIEWESKFFDVCPDFPVSAYPDYSDITLIQLLRHQAGIVSKETEYWELMNPNLDNVSVHSGSTLTFYCQAYLFKENDLGVILFTNCTPGNSQIIIEPVLDEVLNLFVNP